MLWPKSDVRDLLLWRDVYVSELRQGTSASVAAAPSSAPTAATAPAASTTGVTSTSNQSDDSRYGRCNAIPLCLLSSTERGVLEASKGTPDYVSAR